MRVAVMSDIHGNLFALEAALQDMETTSIDKSVCLGDTVQGGPQPAETVKKLRELACPVVLGNADAWLLSDESAPAEPTTAEQREVRAWTLSKLSADDMAFLQTYQRTVEVELDGERRLLCFHGSPHSYDDVLLPDTPKEKWDQLLEQFSPSIMAGGHTHTQQVRRVGEGLFFNPGSVGVAYDYHLPKSRFHLEPWAEYAILSYDRGRLGLEFRRVRYELDDLIRIVRESGRPHGDLMIDDYRRPG